jgi:outer membrane protein
MKRYLALFCIFTLSGSAAAEEALTWKECVAIAARHNPNLLSALAAVEASRADYKGSFNALLPTLSLSNTYNRYFTSTNRVLPDGTVGRANSYSTSWRADGTARLNLIDVAGWTGIQSAAADLRQSEAGLRVQGSATLLDLFTAFADLLYAQEAINVNTTIRNTLKTNAQMIQLRYQSGRESRGNRMNTEAQLLDAEATLAQSKRQLRVAQQRLAEALGNDAFHAYRVVGTWETPAAPDPHPDMDRWLALQPQVQQQTAAAEVSRLAIRKARSVLFPTLGLAYSRGYQGETEFPDAPYWTFSGTLNYDIFGGGPTAAYYASQSAQRSYDEAQQKLRALRSQVLGDLEDAWAAFVNAEEQVNVQRSFLDAARQRKEESDVRYQNGLMNFEDWNRVVQDYVRYQTSYLRAEQSLVLAQAKWRSVTGEQLGDSL